MADLATLILQCAIAVHPQTALAVVQTESQGNPYALNTQVASYYPASREEATARLDDALRAGRSTDIGLMQINSQWLRRLQIPAEATDC
jgi:type IV secretion system protein VirB1